MRPIADEPTSQDRLDRERYARALAAVVDKCEKPMVIGLYGTWGIGKTSLMRMIQKRVDASETHVIWFDPWQHQFDENPALSLLHAAVASFGRDPSSDTKKLLKVIAAAFGSIALRATTGLRLLDIWRLGERIEEEAFRVREARVRLREHFRKLLDSLRAKSELQLAFFIDDLDRCLPAQILSLLEALKVYLSLPGCVYLLAVDRSALELSIRHHYSDLQISAAEYLDKIVQLPFNIPPIPPESMGNFVEPLLGELACCKNILIKGLGDNPRQTKRFINTLMLSDELARQSNIEDYDPKLMAAALWLQHRKPEVYLERKPTHLAEVFRERLDSDFDEIAREVDIPQKGFEQYIYLTRVLETAPVVLEQRQPRQPADELYWVGRQLEEAGKKKAALVSYERLIEEKREPAELLRFRVAAIKAELADKLDEAKRLSEAADQLESHLEF